MFGSNSAEYNNLTKNYTSYLYQGPYGGEGHSHRRQLVFYSRYLSKLQSAQESSQTKTLDLCRNANLYFLFLLI